jgi:hypothetical protein
LIGYALYRFLILIAASPAIPEPNNQNAPGIGTSVTNISAQSRFRNYTPGEPVTLTKRA